ncbi:hypothetical protein ACFQH6_17775 [Halobacteriaceae archaeon GCM10025711]
MTHPDDDPYVLSDAETRHAFWADTVADRIEAREPDEPIVIKGGISPSGVPHLGNMNEIMRGYFVAEVLRERGHEVRQVFTADDRDPLRKLPANSPTSTAPSSASATWTPARSAATSATPTRTSPTRSAAVTPTATTSRTSSAGARRCSAWTWR